MTSVFKREFRSCFLSGTGLVMSALFVFIVGIFASAGNFLGYDNFAYTLYNSGFLYLILVPVLTMRSFSEERKQKTDQLLYSLPLGSAQIVCAKYFALLAALAVPTLICALVPLAMSLYGNVNFILSLSSLFGFYLLGAALIAVGIFISSLTDNQLVAAYTSFFVLFAVYFLGNVSKMIPSDPAVCAVIFAVLAALICLVFYNLTKSRALGIGLWCVLLIPIILVSILSPQTPALCLAFICSRAALFDRLGNFSLGIFDAVTLVFYISVCVLFVFFTVQSFEKRRWS
ncbi:MAG: ABC transporter [Clostridia bacterium]|nr:ABC transporter [Clostridia bacterium]